jgi:glycosyltransferase involved in cell wall biosynthesis/GT2 family glycosyltransferase
MKLHILTNALDYGDAVSAHCILLARRARELGIEARLYAEFSEPRVARYVTPLERLRTHADKDDLLLHQFFNYTTLIPAVDAFPGKRILMYHNITPTEFFAENSPARESCSRGLDQLRELAGLYDLAAGMSEFSRRDLVANGYPNAGIFPLFVDIERLQSRSNAEPARRPDQTTFLFVGRIAPNKGIAELVKMLAAYRQKHPQSRLVLVGDDAQHAAYTRKVQELAVRLRMSIGEHIVFTGKIPDHELARWYRTADAFVCLSEHEGFCAPLIESMAFDLPVFAAPAGAIEETMNGAGVLLSGRDPAMVAEEIRRVLENPGARDAMVRKQKARAEGFSAEAQRTALRALIDLKLPARAPRVQPRVSVVINTYNRARHLETCLATLRRQTYRNFEVLVVNGPSTDNTAEVLSRFDGQIRVAETKERILGVSRNLGIDASASDLVAFIDDDAIAEPHWLAELVKPFADPSVGAAGGLVYRMNGQDIEFANGIIDREAFVEWNRPQPGQHWTWKDGHLNTVSGNNCIFRRNALEKIGGFDEAIEYYHDEADVVIRLAAEGLRTVHCPGAVVYHEGATSQNRTGKYTLNWYVIAKNTVYCSLKNRAAEAAPWPAAARVARRVVRARMGDIFRWWAGGEIGAGQFVKMEIACARGIAAGVRRGIHPQPPKRIIADSRGLEFLPYSEPKQHGMSVCLLSQSLPDVSPGGIATYTSALARGLRRLGCTVHIVSKGDRYDSQLRDGIWHHTAAPIAMGRGDRLETHATAARNLAYSNGVRAKLLDIHARWGIDVIESPNWDAEGLLAAVEHRAPMVVRAHSPLFKVAETQGWEITADLEECIALEALLLRHADVVTGSTRAILGLMEGMVDPDARTALLPLGLDVQAEADTMPRNGTCKVLFVGRLEPRKGILTLLDAMPTVLEQSASVEFHIAGADESGPASWRQLWEHAGGHERVKFHGEVSAGELLRLYRECDVFVAPSTYESFGLVYLEAMAHGKPVIGCRTGGVPEVVADGETGILIPPGDSSSLARAILRLAEDGEFANRLGSAGLARYRDSFTVDAMAARTAALFKKLAEAHKSAADVAWRGVIMDLRREPEAQVLWHGETEQLCLMIRKGAARTAVFGPYVALRPRDYRAEFKLWQGEPARAGARIVTVDVFSPKSGKLGERTFYAADFTGGPGSVLDIYFSLRGNAVDDAEFRVHTSGEVPLYLREVLVTEWPRERAVIELADEQIFPSAAEQVAP